MKIKHHDIVIDKENPFANCALDRFQYAEVLTSIVKNYAEGFVLAINNEWGTGKTTFVKMWKQQLTNEGFKTLYFNAWENDFEINPLIAFLAELKKLTKGNSDDTFKKLLAKGAMIVKNVAPVLVKAIVDKYIDTEVLKEGLVEASKGAVDVLEDDIKEYTKKKDGIIEFRKALETFIQKLNSDKPLVFIIDELDRCRPNYAVELLEQIKHFFSISGIVFVLAIDKEQLGYAVRGVYGSESLNADEYLRRFIDLEYSIPSPNTTQFCTYLYDYFDFESFFNSDRRKEIGEFRSNGRAFIEIASILFDLSGLNLRQQEKLFIHARIGLGSFKFNEYTFPELYLVLVYLKNYQKSFYLSLQQKKFTMEELISNFASLLPKTIDNSEQEEFIYVEALLVFLYNNYIHFRSKKELIITDEQTKSETAFVKSKIDISDGQYSFVRNLKAFSNSFDFSHIGIDFLTKKIDLIEKVIE